SQFEALFLGRTHTVVETRAAIEAAAGSYERWSMDLIYARPGQNLTAWRAELDDALGYGPRHLSAYQLTIEKGTPFFAAHRDGAFTLPGEDLGAALYEATGDALRAAGLAAYEVSNYAAPGEESRHNLSYWRYRDYAGIGPGAHGRVTVDGTVRATRRIAAPQAWLQQVEAKGHGLQGDEALGPRTVRDEVTMMGLRLAEGIERGAFEARTGQSFEAAFDAGRWTALVDEGLLILGATHIRATRTGRLRLNALLSHLLDH
ncbi:MAG: coproporphyrinogen-III oxidase family protein, partial [Alphaproteobacteria bacterium]|nr:coproporphyrinogen-III oxidase family protein [Alphaproteobacteria bacterium]